MLRIKELREARGEMQKVIAKALGIAPSTYSQYETGKREPDYSTLSKIADFFNVSVDYLLGKTDNKNSPALTEQGADILDEVDIAFYGEYKKLDEADKDVLRDMVRVMRERRTKRQEK